jgi:hypothetical protein
MFLLLQIVDGLPLCGFKDPFLPLHPRVQLRFNLEGKPLPGANIELYFGKPSPTNDLPYETGVTDSNGIAITSELPVATFTSEFPLVTFQIRVLSRDHQITEFTIDTPLEKELHAIKGKVELIATPLNYVEDSEPCCGACSVVVDKTLQAEVQALRGVVMDQMGAVLLAIIEVHQNEESKIVIRHLTTDGAGRFDTELAPGKYLVIFKACGFDVQKVVVTVGTGGWRGMQIGLGVGHRCGSREPGNEARITPLN